MLSSKRMSLGLNALLRELMALRAGNARNLRVKQIWGRRDSFSADTGPSSADLALRDSALDAWNA